MQEPEIRPLTHTHKLIGLQQGREGRSSRPGLGSASCTQIWRLARRAKYTHPKSRKWETRPHQGSNQALNSCSREGSQARSGCGKPPAPSGTVSFNPPSCLVYREGNGTAELCAVLKTDPNQVKVTQLV